MSRQNQNTPKPTATAAPATNITTATAVTVAATAVTVDSSNTASVSDVLAVLTKQPLEADAFKPGEPEATATARTSYNDPGTSAPRTDAQKPSVGRIVHFFEDVCGRLEARAAMITKVWTDHTVNLTIFDQDGTTRGGASISRGHGAGEWMWPPRA